MFETNSKHIHVYLLWLAVIIALLSPIYLSLCFSKSIPAPMNTQSIAVEHNRPTENNSLKHTEQRVQSTILRTANRMATRGFDPSLEMKENVDFLLTPALLVQEAISDDIVITYPSE